MTRTTSAAGIALIKEFEGCRLEAYQDSVGVWTIGYGHIKTARKGMVITQCQADALLVQDVADHERFIHLYIYTDLEQHQFDALSSFVFNLGGGALRDSTLRKMINSGDIKSAAPQFDRWNKAGGKVLAGLVRRRAAERRMFEGLS